MSTRYVPSKIQWGNIIHLAQNIALPLAALLLIQRGLTELAIGLVIIGKWRIIAVQPRHWFANLRANSPDLIVGISSLVFIDTAPDLTDNDNAILLVQFGWTLWYLIWLIFIKPRSSEVWVGVQALASHLLGLTALYIYADQAPEALVVIGAWFIALTSARHFISSYEEPLIRMMSFGWAFFVAQMAWWLNRWLLIYDLSPVVRIPQITVVTVVLGYIIGMTYYLQRNGRLKTTHVREFFVIGCAILLAVIFLSDWRGGF